LNEELLDWADEICVMENKHREWIRSNGKKKFDKKISVLQIQDIYVYGEMELINILTKKMDHLLKNR